MAPILLAMELPLNYSLFQEVHKQAALRACDLLWIHKSNANYGNWPCSDRWEFGESKTTSIVKKHIMYIP
jgi:hypothetical protein